MKLISKTLAPIIHYSIMSEAVLV